MNIGIFEAVKSLHPSAKPDIDFSLQDDGQGPYIKFWSYESPAPTDAEIEAEIYRLQAEYEAKEYQRDRATAYPSIQEQLDLLYWDKINGTDNWEQAIAAVKAEYPKG
jgi:hypothetical protein